MGMARIPKKKQTPACELATTMFKTASCLSFKRGFKTSVQFSRHYATHIRDHQHYKDLYAHSVGHPEQFWAETAKTLDWFTPPKTVTRGTFEETNVEWFPDGYLNASANCIDRHLQKMGNKNAIIWEADDPAESRTITYNELYKQVCQVANALKSFGLKKGDCVTLYMPMVPEAAIAMLACSRLGIVHNVVFAGFSAAALSQRIAASHSQVVITANEGVRGGKKVSLKDTVDAALDNLPQVKNVLVFQRTQTHTHMQGNRDVWWHHIVPSQKPTCPPVAVNSEDPLFYLFTSGSTGKPKGLEHTTGGYLLYTATTHKYVFDIQQDDVFACMADIGWVTGHSYIVYGPLLNGVTTLIFESIPTYPTPSRYWQIVEKYKVTQLYTAPTAIRALMKFGDEPTKGFDFSSIRLLGTVGEPVNPATWQWFRHHIGKDNVPFVDTYWQTETGATILTPLPGTPIGKPGAAMLPFFGIELAIVDPSSRLELSGNSVEGALVIKKPWPGIARTVFGDHQRYYDAYFKEYSPYYATGDAALRDADSDYWITGRIDGTIRICPSPFDIQDVINKAGHRMGTAEIESALVGEHCVEAAVVTTPHDVFGEQIWAYCVLKDGTSAGQAVVNLLRAKVAAEISKIAAPDHIIVGYALPKTRSGKIMRRVLRKISEGKITPEDLGDLSTLAEPEIVDSLIKLVQQEKKD